MSDREEGAMAKRKLYRLRIVLTEHQYWATMEWFSRALAETLRVGRHAIDGVNKVHGMLIDRGMVKPTVSEPVRENPSPESPDAR